MKITEEMLVLYSLILARNLLKVCVEFDKTYVCSQPPKFSLNFIQFNVKVSRIVMAGYHTTSNHLQIGCRENPQPHGMKRLVFPVK